MTVECTDRKKKKPSNKLVHKDGVDLPVPQVRVLELKVLCLVLSLVGDDLQLVQEPSLVVPPPLPPAGAGNRTFRTRTLRLPPLFRHEKSTRI